MTGAGSHGWTVELLQPADHQALALMLEEEGERIDQSVAKSYRRGSFSGITWVAWRGDEIAGMIRGYLQHDLAEDVSFRQVVLPPKPHAMLDRLIVRESSTFDGAGRALVEAFTREAKVQRCTFIGGFVDASSDPEGRRKFFHKCGFQFYEADLFGAPVVDVVSHLLS